MPASRDIERFFKTRGDALEKATEAGIKRAAKEFTRKANRQLKSRFKSRAGRAKAKSYRARGALPFASIVSIKPVYLQVFEEGTTIKGSKFLVIPIAPFKRVGKRGWQYTFQLLKSRGKVAIIPTQSGGYLVTLNGKPAYTLTREADIPKRLDLISTARTEGKKIEKYIEDLINA